MEPYWSPLVLIDSVFIPEEPLGSKRPLEKGPFG